MTVIIKGSNGKIIKDATMVANDLKSGKVGYNNKGRVVGTFNPSLSNIPTKTQIITFDPPTGNYYDENKYTIDNIISKEYLHYTISGNGTNRYISGVQNTRTNYSWKYAKSINLNNNVILGIKIGDYAVNDMPAIYPSYNGMSEYIEVADMYSSSIRILFTYYRAYIQRVKDQDDITITYI